MAAKALPSKAELDQLLNYDASVGKLRWKERAVDLFPLSIRSPVTRAKAWNKRFAGKEAFLTVRTGYLYGRIFGVSISAHRAIWCLYAGSWPTGEIDHIDGDRLNNRISNLRCVTAGENQKNRPRQRNNTSGAHGIYWHQVAQKWCAQIKVNGAVHYLGLFESLDEAKNRRNEAEILFEFHPNHGRG